MRELISVIDLNCYTILTKSLKVTNNKNKKSPAGYKFFPFSVSYESVMSHSIIQELGHNCKEILQSTKVRIGIS